MTTLTQWDIDSFRTIIHREYFLQEILCKVTKSLVNSNNSRDSMWNGKYLRILEFLKNRDPPVRFLFSRVHVVQGLLIWNRCCDHLHPQHAANARMPNIEYVIDRLALLFLDWLVIFGWELYGIGLVHKM